MENATGAFAGLVVVTNRKLCPSLLSEQLERVLLQGPRAVILREKDLEPRAYEELAEEVLLLCAQHETSCYIHTHANIALTLGCRKLHLSLPTLRATDRSTRSCFGELGCSVHSVEEAVEAQALGATRLIAGHIFDTQCKPGLEARGLEFLEAVCAAVKVPVYAIGGIDLDQKKIAACRAVGAAGCCTMSAAMRFE